MPRGINVARLAGTGGTPNVISGKYATGQTFKKGALLVKNGSGELIECSADPATVVGVAMEAAASKPGYELGHASKVLQVTGITQEVSYAVADRDTVFSMRGVNGGTDPETPTQAHEAAAGYGVAKVGNDWVLDIAETTAKVFKVVDKDVDNKIFLCKFLEAVLQTP